MCFLHDMIRLILIYRIAHCPIHLKMNVDSTMPILIGRPLTSFESLGVNLETMMVCTCNSHIRDLHKTF